MRSSSPHQASLASAGNGSPPVLSMSSNSCSSANHATAISRCDSATNGAATDHSGQRLRHLSRKLSSAVLLTTSFLTAGPVLPAGSARGWPVAEVRRSRPARRHRPAGGAATPGRPPATGPASCLPCCGSRR
ncbi:hypothetical protein G6F32_016705 [Rhizopus arrhizus]|nr:hypothetical protein G6F32_016705 [Rhizopus arrhizus]